jgi:hypothetical protein
VKRSAGHDSVSYPNAARLNALADSQGSTLRERREHPQIQDTDCFGKPGKVGHESAVPERDQRHGGRERSPSDEDRSGHSTNGANGCRSDEHAGHPSRVAVWSVPFLDDVLFDVESRDKLKGDSGSY